VNFIHIFKEIMGLKDQLNGIIPDRARHRLSDHFDVIGEIAILSLSPELCRYEGEIAHAVLSHNRRIRTVLNKISRLAGCNRTAGYEIISGKGTVTIHHEYGFAYQLDVATVFFNPRLARERRRVTGQVHDGERVLVPFCGVGPFVIPAAARGGVVVAVEKNAEALRWLAGNVERNGVGDRVTILGGDAFDTSRFPTGSFDRLIIPTPYGQEKILEVLEPRVKQGGIIHFYTFKNRNQAEALADTFATRGFDVLTMRRCGNVAPGVSRWVFDLGT
jgi:tRNA (guanine37-N1)-methyltransferase